MKKKIIISLFMVAMVLALVGCGSDSKTSDNEVKNMGTFEAESITGESVTEDIFTNADITMVNIWSTSCGPCVKEMPEIVELSKNMPEGSQLLTICVDNPPVIDEIEKLVGKDQKNFKTILYNSSLDSVLSQYNYIPTTIFVDKDGNLIGEEEVGIPKNEDTIEGSYKKIIEEKLEEVKK